MSSLLKLIPIVGLFSSMIMNPLFAEATKPSKWDTGSNIIVKDLNLPGKTLAEIVRQITFDLHNTQGLCKTRLRTEPSLLADCLRGTPENYFSGAIKPYIQYAVKNEKIDKVEALALMVALSSVEEVKGSTPEEIVVGTPLMEAPAGKNTPLPALMSYRQNKAAFLALRKFKNREAVLPKALLDQTAKQFQRSINGVGAVTPEQFFAAQMGRLQLNTLAGVMVTATDFMSRPNARIILYPAGYSFNTAQLKMLQEKEIELAQRILDEDDVNTRTDLQATLQKLLQQTKQYKQKDLVDELIAEREEKTNELQEELLQLSSLSLNDKESRAELAKNFQKSISSLNSIDQQIAGLIKIEELPPEDLQRFVMNALNSDIQALMQQNAFQGLDLRVADTLLAAWVAGDISSEAFTSLAQLANMKEQHISVWSKALSVSWTIGKAALMAFPTTAYIAIGISIFESVNKTLAAQKEQKSNETHLIPLNK
jgi:hypothetical protein